MIQGSTTVIEYYFTKEIDHDFIDSIKEKKFILYNGLEQLHKDRFLKLTNKVTKIERDTGITIDINKLSITLTAYETLYLSPNVLTGIQFKLITNDNKVIQTEIAEIEVQQSLFKEEDNGG